MSLWAYIVPLMMSEGGVAAMTWTMNCLHKCSGFLMTPTLDEETVIVQEDQAEGLGLLYQGLYTYKKAFKAPPEYPINSNTVILEMSHYCTCVTQAD